jgi:hypothetical protein
MIRKIPLFAGALLLGCGSALAAPPDPLGTFAPLILPTPPGATRSAGGLPGPAYWQNRADYKITARIDTAAKVLTATETITYTNNSPDPLDVLWVQLDQNIYRPDSRASFMPQYRPRGADEHSDGYTVQTVTIEADGKTYTPEKIVSDTRMQLRLTTPLIAKGGLLKIHIAYHYTVPGEWGGRTAVTPSKNGDIYEIAQWFPRMAVYDDLRGWDTAPYLGQEFSPGTLLSPAPAACKTRRTC